VPDEQYAAARTYVLARGTDIEIVEPTESVAEDVATTEY
jgi:hypothetical protein